MENLTITVTLETAQAIESGQTMAGVVRQLAEETSKLAPQVQQLDTATVNLAAAEADAAVASANLATAAKGLTTETAAAGKAQADSVPATEKATEAKARSARESDRLADAERRAADEAKKLAERQRSLAEAATDVANDITRAIGATDKIATSTDAAEKKVRSFDGSLGSLADVLNGTKTAEQHFAEQAEAAGDAAVRAAGGITKAGDAAKKTETPAVSASKAFGLLNSATAAFGLGGFGALEIASKFLAKIREDAEAAAAAIAKAGGTQRQFTISTEELRDNLGVLPGDKRAEKVAADYMRQTGATVEQASKIMSGMNPTFPIIDPAKPEEDGKSPGFEIAVELGKFLRRTRTPDKVSGEVPKILANMGVTNKDEALKVLSQLEAGANSININNAGEFIEQAIKLQAGRPQGTLKETLADLAATAVGEPSADVAGTLVKEGRSVFAGKASKLPNAGRLALEAGTLTEQQVRAETPASPREAEFARDEAALDNKDRKGDVGVRRKREDSAAARDQLRREQDKFGRSRTDKAFTRLAPAAQQAKIEDEQAKFAQREREIARKEEDLAADPNNTAPQRAALAEKRQAEAAKMRDIGLARAYTKLPLLQREAFGRKLYAGKTPEQQEALTQQLTEGDEGRAGIRAMTSPTAHKARANTEAAVDAAKPADTERKNELALRSELGRAAVQEARNISQQLETPGAAFDADANAFVTQDQDQLTRETPIIPKSSYFPLTLNKQNNSLYAWNEGQRNQQRKAAFVLKSWQDLVAGLLPKTRAAIGETTLTRYDDYFNRVYNTIVNEGFDQPNSATRAAKMAQAFGVIEQAARNAATRRGELLPDITQPLGKAMVPNVDRFTGKAQASPTVQPPTAAESREAMLNDPRGDTPPAVPPLLAPATPDRLTVPATPAVPSANASPTLVNPPAGPPSVAKQPTLVLRPGVKPLVPLPPRPELARVPTPTPAASGKPPAGAKSDEAKAPTTSKTFLSEKPKTKEEAVERVREAMKFGPDERRLARLDLQEFEIGLMSPEEEADRQELRQKFGGGGPAGQAATQPSVSQVPTSPTAAASAPPEFQQMFAAMPEAAAASSNVTQVTNHFHYSPQQHVGTYVAQDRGNWDFPGRLQFLDG